MALSRVHTSAKAADAIKLLLLIKKTPSVVEYDLAPPNRNPRPTPAET